MSVEFIERKIGDLKVIELPGDPRQGAVVLLHGYGAGPFDLFPLNGLYKGPSWYFPQGPHELFFSPDYTGHAWFPINFELINEAVRTRDTSKVAKAFPKELESARNVIEELLAALEIPRNQIVLGGFSQGAVLTVEVAFKSNTPLGGLLLFSGTYVEQLEWKKPISQSKMPFFQSHGTTDSLLPFEKARELEFFLQQAGLVGKLHPFNGGHEIPQNILIQAGNFLSSLFSQSFK